MLIEPKPGNSPKYGEGGPCPNTHMRGTMSSNTKLRVKGNKQKWEKSRCYKVMGSRLLLLFLYPLTCPVCLPISSKYSGDPNTGQVWFSNAVIVRYCLTTR